MQKQRVAINSFQFGEVSDSLRMRTDTSVYPASASKLENLIVMSEGSVKKRFGLKHIHDYSITFNALYPEQSHLFPFVFDENEEYIISVEHLKIRCFRLVSDGSVSLVSTITVDSGGFALPFNQLYLNQYTAAQYGDVMFICHPLFAPRVLTRTSLTDFNVSTYTFDQRADSKKTYQPYAKFQKHGITLDPSATTGGSITLTTSADYWDSTLHAGVRVRYGTNEILIGSVTSPTVAVGSVLEELKIRLTVLDPLRTIDTSTTIEVTHLDHGFGGGETIVFEEASGVGGITAANINGSRTVGTIIDDNTYTITAGAAANTSEDGGGYVKVVTHAPTADWDEQSFSAKRGYPAAVEFHENRLVFGGTLSEPDVIWMSKLGDYFNFDLGDASDDDGIALAAATGDVNEIRYLYSNRDLQVFTASNELYVPTYLNQAITPTNAQIRKQTPYGSLHVCPVSIDGATVFCQNNGKIVREFLYTETEEAYTATAISTLSSHLAQNPKYLCVAHSGFGLPDSYAAFTLSNGDISLFSSNRAEKRASWTRVTTDGNFGSVASVEDRLFANVTDSNGKLHLCEFTGEIGLDYYVYGALSSNLLDVSSAHSSGTVLDVVATDGTTLSSIGSFTVNSANKIDISTFSGYGFTHAYAGKKYTAKLVTNPVDGQSRSGPLTGKVRGITNVVVDFTDTRSANVNTHTMYLDNSFTGKKEFRVLGYSRDPKVTIDQSDPLGLQVNGIIAEIVY